MDNEKMSAEAESALQKFKDAFIGKRVKIVGIDHPHRDESGTCSSVDYTNVGWGLKIDLENNESCYSFKGTDIRFDPMFE